METASGMTSLHVKQGGLSTTRGMGTLECVLLLLLLLLLVGIPGLSLGEGDKQDGRVAVAQTGGLVFVLA